MTIPSYRGLRVGYLPYSPDFSAPGDRRRFCYFAQKRRIEWEFARPDGEYDVLVLSERANPGAWSRYPLGRTKMIYELVDAYLVPPSGGLRRFRNLAKAVVGGYPRFDFLGALRNMCMRADAVICASEAQRQVIAPYCANTHLILDFHGAVARKVKTDYSAGDRFNLIWEGLGFSLGYFREIRRPLQQLAARRKLAIHIATDLEFTTYWIRKHWAGDVVRETMGDLASQVYLYQWNEELIASIVCSCDLAVIPVPLHDPFLAAKSENKLLLFWRMGMPTITSATPAYQSAMQLCGLDTACGTEEQWVKALERYAASEADRRAAGQAGLGFVEHNYSEDRILGQWDDLFASVLV